jgi:hypothetical protein
MKSFLPFTAALLLALSACTPIQGQPVTEYVANENFHALSSCFMRNIQNNVGPAYLGALTHPGGAAETHCYADI